MLNISLTDLFGRAQHCADSGDMPRALALYREWLAANPDHALRYAALFNLGILWDQHGESDAARDAFREAAQSNPQFLPPFINLGLAHERAGEALAALEHWTYVTNRLAAATGDGIANKVQALKHMARLLESHRALGQAEDALRSILEIAPDQMDVAQRRISLRQRLCHWPLVPTEANRAEVLRGMAPLSLAYHCDDPLLHLGAAWACSRKEAPMPESFHTAGDFARHAGRRLRIGYLSSDLRDHAIGYLTAGIFRRHDRTAFEVFVYYNGIARDDATKLRIRCDAEHWRDIAPMDDSTALRCMREDGIDILVDVNGHTSGVRLKLLSRRPAPAIVNWLGFPGSMGSAFHHYIIADPVIVPPDSEMHYSETVLRLPCYQPNNPDRVVAEQTPSREACGLPEDALVFCSFNGMQKITRFVFARWMRILQGVPDSVLWLMEGGEEVQATLHARAAEAGIAPARLVFAPPLPNAAHLARYRLADLFLDTAPYGAHTTASDALWMGVPVLTVPGRAFASRVCTSLVRAAGVPELACATLEEYVQHAIALGQDRPRLAAYRERLLQLRATSTLFDAAGFVRHLEALYRGIAEDIAAGRVPSPDLTNCETYLEIGAGFDHDAEEFSALPDYAERYRGALARRHAYEPLPPDRRLWKDQCLAGL